MTKLFYQPHTLLVKPIAKPAKISIFKHIVLFINEEDNSIERAIPDFDEVHMDAQSSNIEKSAGKALAFFEMLNQNQVSDEPVFEITVYEGNKNNPIEYNGPKIVSCKCINGYSCSLEDVIYEKDARKEKTKKRLIFTPKK